MTSILLPFKRCRSSPDLHSSNDDFSYSTRSVMSEDFQFFSSKEAEADCMREIYECFRKFGVRLPEEKVFRYACFHQFDDEEAIEGIREDNYNPYMKLKMKDLVDHFESDGLFPIPQLRSRKNTEVVYMRPARFNPAQTGCNKVIASLCYVFNDLSQTEEQCRNGVTVIADMRNIRKENFSKENCTKLVEALQGHMVPTRVETFLIVSPPSWFGEIWKWMKSTMSRDFAKRVHLIKEERISEFLMDDYELYLPDGFCRGLAHASEISEDYVDLKMLQEQSTQ